MDLLHVYSNLWGGSARVRELIAKARKSTRTSGDTTVLKRARQLRPEAIERLLEHYRENGSVVAAAKALSITRQTAGKYLAEAGITTTRRISASEIAIARDARNAGRSYASIGRTLGFSAGTILTALRES